jgi:hypothetical protein
MRLLKMCKDGIDVDGEAFILESRVWSEKEEEKHGVTHVVALLPSLASVSG